MTDNKDIVDALNNLITTNYDRERGYKEAAGDVTDGRLKSWFNEYAQQSYDFGHEIKAEIKVLGGEPDKGTSLAADAHRVWIDLKSAIAGNDEAAVIDEAIRGEENAVSRYQDVLNEGSLPATTRTVVARQKGQIEAALSKMQQLKSTFAAA